MIYTSYFGNLKNLPENMIPIAICGKSPNWYKGLEYKKLAPKYGFFMEWKENHNNDYYIKCFKEQVTDKLNLDLVLSELFYLLPENIQNELLKDESPWYLSKKYHICFICYEKPDDFCHRHLSADWMNFESNNVLNIVEYNKKYA